MKGNGIEVSKGTLFAIIVISALVSNWSVLMDNAPIIGGALICLMVTLLIVGFVAPLLLGSPAIEAKTISIETGIQNSTLGIVIASLIVGGDAGFTAYSIPAAVYGIIMYLIVIPILPLYRKIGIQNPIGNS